MKNMSIRRIAALLLFLCFVLTTASCATRSVTKYASKTFLMMDTVIEIKLACTTETAQPIFAKCGEIMTACEQLLSKTISDSAVARFNRDGNVTCGEREAALIRRMLEICLRTDGAFDPTVEPLVALWNTCGETDRLPSARELTHILDAVGYEKLALSADGTLIRSNPNTAIDLGAIGKGYAIEQVLTYLNSTDIPGGVVSFGGNVAVFGQKQSGEDYRIGVRDPQNMSGVLGYLNMPSGVISVSGDYERYVTIAGQRYHHIIDPATGYPTDNGLHSVAVICEDAVLADALSTALFVMGAERALAFYRTGIYDFEAILTTDSTVILTDGLAASDSFDLTAGGYALIPG